MMVDERPDWWMEGERPDWWMVKVSLVVAQYNPGFWDVHYESKLYEVIFRWLPNTTPVFGMYTTAVQ